MFEAIRNVDLYRVMYELRIILINGIMIITLILIDLQ